MLVTEERWTSYCCPVSIVDLTDAMDLSVNDLIMSHVVLQNNTRVMLGSPPTEVSSSSSLALITYYNLANDYAS